MKTATTKDKTHWSAIILAAGKGTRMNSALPKVLHPVAGRPMVVSIIQACKQAGIEEIRVVVGHGQGLVQEVLQPFGVNCLVQTSQLGTADAVKSAQVDSLDGNVIILNGDHPLITSEDLTHFISTFTESKAELSVVTCKLKDPGAFGRVVRSQGELMAIVEAKDASASTLKINEVNTGIYLCAAGILQEDLPKIKNNNQKGEYYLTDLISIANEASSRVKTIEGNPRVARGVNNQQELAMATRLAFKRKSKELMDSGVLILDPRTAYIEASVSVVAGAVIHPNVHLKGKTQIGAFSVVEPNCIVINSVIHEAVQIKANSVVEGAIIMNRASVGPFARIRPETEISEEAHIGNFVELKKVKFGARSKAGHLTYLGDAEIGTNTNIGCGTITCNYAVDHKKYKTRIGNDVFIGSDTQFIAPIEVGDRAVIASGSTITESVPSGGFAVARGRQYTKPGKE